MIVGAAIIVSKDQFLAAVLVEDLRLASLQHFANVWTAYLSVGRRRQHQVLL